MGTVPSLGVKADAVPGRLNQLKFIIQRPGLYFGQCSEICGANHRFMPIVVEPAAPVKSVRIRVGRSIDGFGLSPGITREQRLAQETLMKSAFAKLQGDLAGKYFPLLGMNEADRQQLVDDHFLFISGDKNLIAAGMERDWPEGRGIFHNADKTFLVWVNEEDQLRIISMQKGGDVKG